MVARHLFTRPAYCGLYLALCALTTGVEAAPRFDPASEPQVTVAPIALSNTDLRPLPGVRPNGGAAGYRPWFENGAWQGDLIELDVSAGGAISSTVDPELIGPATTTTGENWSARARFNALAAGNTDFWDDGTRKIIIGDGSGAATPFRWQALSAAQQRQITDAAQNPDGVRIVNFLRGDRSSERFPANPAGDLRRRLNILGDIVHSPPKFVGAPSQDFTLDNYEAFAAANRNRPPRVYVGANDGMLHAFDAASGDEVFAYIPSMVGANLGRLTRLPYVHTYFVDGQLASGDVFINGQWRTVIVGGLGAGGRGFFALDITDANVTSEAELADRLMWEVTAADEDIGFSYSRPTIARLNDNRWYAVVGNGYNSAGGKAKLLLIDIETGNVREIDTDNSGNRGNPNGLSSPSLVDIDNNQTADVAYAGDIDGNLWKFDLRDSSPLQWRLAFNGQPLLTLGVARPIVVPPDVARGVNPGEFIVYIGSGRAFTSEDLDDNTAQSLYGVIDDQQAAGNLNPVMQTLRESVFPVPLQTVRTTTARPLNTAGTEPNRAWRVEFPPGERFLTELQTRAGRVQALSFNPVVNLQENWLTQPAFDNGGAPRETILDLNNDGALDSNDHVDGDGDGRISAAEEDTPMGLLLGAGIRSRPTIAVINAEVDTALINGLFVPAVSDCPVGFQDICLGRFTDLGEAEDRLEERQREIESLRELVDRLNAELARLQALENSLRAELDALREANADQQSIDAKQRELNEASGNADNTRSQRDRTRNSLRRAERQRRQAINFIEGLEEDRRQRANGETLQVDAAGINSVNSLGPNFSLGRRSWVELEP